MGFEVRKRDALARLSVYQRDDLTLALPAVVETDRIFPSLERHRLDNMPLLADAGLAGAYHACGDDEPVWVHPAVECPAVSGSCVMVGNWHTALAQSREYVQWLSTLKSMVPPDTAWYAPGTALPSNAAILCYSGFDLFDYQGVDLASAQGLYCLPEGTFPAEWMESEACTCEGCRDGDIFRHNRYALEKELALVRRFIGEARLRDLVESRCRFFPPQVAILRLLDSARSLMEPAVPVARSVPLLATTGESLHRFEVTRFAERVIGRYSPPVAETAVLLPCSAHKPYSLSASHRRFIPVIAGRAHELILTSPLGLVPRELELVYPAAHYDVPVTGYWDAEERERIAAILAGYLAKNPYKRVIAHLEGGALATAEMAADAAGITLECTCSGHPASSQSLTALDAALVGERKVRHDLVRGTGLWQFGAEIAAKGLFLKGRYPQVMAYRGKDPLFSLDTGTGLLRPTLKGWELIPTGYRVTIDDFIPQGDILAPGVIDADPAIREGDEVFVTGPGVEASGRAAMPAGEMLRSSRGVAVRVRKVKRIQQL
ncbi:archaeosine synthase [Methanolinea mesophila]|uniref:archaeosine synthase subunit alpha n=1 Tax=Methanolinea mesophila TaxID=547055 RepID=UPI001AE980DF|nr:archaeosine synthase subunit alpha [Methanolinea mesophila]MBP1927849.1 archaeosine synthase [Methanolinea mesophila]